MTKTSLIPEVEMRWIGRTLQYRMVRHVFVDDGEESGIVDTITEDWKTCQQCKATKDEIK